MALPVPKISASTQDVSLTSTSSGDVTALVVNLCLLEAGWSSTELDASVLLLLMRSVCVASLLSSVGKVASVRRIIERIVLQGKPEQSSCMQALAIFCNRVLTKIYALNMRCTNQGSTGTA